MVYQGKSTKSRSLKNVRAIVNSWRANKPGKYVEPDSPNRDQLKAQKNSQVASGVRPPSTNRTYTQGENYSNTRTNIYPSINNSTSGKHRDPPA